MAKIQSNDRFGLKVKKSRLRVGFVIVIEPTIFVAIYSCCTNISRNVLETVEVSVSTYPPLSLKLPIVPLHLSLNHEDQVMLTRDLAFSHAFFPIGT